MELIKKLYKDLKLICEKNKVDKLYLFGSALTNRFDEQKSDLDFLVEMQNMTSIEKGEALIHLWDSLENLFSRKVDLLTENSLKNPYLLKEIEKTADI